MNRSEVSKRNELLYEKAKTLTTKQLAAEFNIHRDYVYLLLRKAGIKPVLNSHKHTVNKKCSPTYDSWQNMKQRALNPNCPDHKYYSSVNICERWMCFLNFLEDMGERPEGTTLGRFKDLGDYKPGNCSWQTREEQWVERKKKKIDKG
jgi:hypothetical protein